MTVEDAGLITANFALILLVILTRRKRSLNNFFIALTSFILVLSLIEVAYRIFFEKEAYYANDFEESFYQSDSMLGYKIEKPGTYEVVRLSNKGDTLFNTTYTTISDSGINPCVHRIGYNKSDDPIEVIFLGCSFTFGEGLHDSLTLPYQFGQLGKVRTTNFGCNGYGIHQVYQLFLDRFSTDSNRNRIFVYTFLYDHLLRANGIYLWNMDGPRFCLEEDSLVRRGKLSDNNIQSRKNAIYYGSLFGSLTFLKKMIAYSQENRLTRKLDSADYEIGFRMLESMAKKIKGSGGSMVILDWDAANWGNKEVGGLREMLIEQKLSALESKGISVIRISSIIRHGDPDNFIPVDGHPSALTNEKIAAYLVNQFKPNGLP